MVVVGRGENEKIVEDGVGRGENEKIVEDTVDALKSVYLVQSSGIIA